MLSDNKVFQEDSYISGFSDVGGGTAGAVIGSEVVCSAGETVGEASFGQ